MDLGLADDVHESFKLFQGRIIQEYDRMVGEFGLRVIDATRDIDDQQTEVREIVSEMLRNGGRE
jgi:dTMP kinase